MLSRRSFLITSSVLLLVLGTASRRAAALDAKDAFEPKTCHDASGKTLPYRIMAPKDYDPNKKYPLVLFLHGAGERGTDNLIQLVHGMNDFSKDENRAKYPCFVVAPQCPTGKRWVEVDWTLDSHKQLPDDSETMKLVLALLSSLQKEYSIDAKRLYVTGLSMGGYGTWDLITRYPHMFAAAAPVCAGADETKASLVAKVPIWTFHGDKDTTVKVSRSRNMIAAIEKAGGKPKYTEYPGVGHNSWKSAYSDPKLLEWMFAQKLPD